METTIPNWLLKRAELSPDRTGLIFNGQAWTFREMCRIVQGTAGKMAGVFPKGINRVAILMNNGPEMVWIIHALQQLGIESVFLNARLATAELSFQIQDSGAGLFIYGKSFSKVAAELNESFSEIMIICSEEILNAAPKEAEPRPEFSLDEICSIMYTSGTTGKPKGVLQTYGNHWWSAAGSVLNIGLQEKDAWLCTVPLFHISGLSILFRSVIYGIPVVLMEKFDEKKVNEWLFSGKVTIMSAVSSMLNRMLRALGDGRYHPEFRCLLAGGGPVPRPLLESCKEKGIPVFQTYGMTETSSQIATLSPEDSLRKLGSAGKPLFPSRLKIMAEGREARPMEEGEILVKGPNVTSGYLNREDANKDSFMDGWFLTGDLGYKDEEGYVYILDRRSDLIISGGENIYPAEIEEVLLSHPSVMDAGVTGFSDEQWGQVPYGFVVVKEQATEGDLVSFCRENLAPYKVPKRIFMVEQLPRNGANKLLRRKLDTLIDGEK